MGVLGILAGILVVQHPLWSTVLIPTILVIFLAIQAIVVGLIGLVMAFSNRSWGAGILGVLGIFFGIILLMNPLLTAAALPWVLGVFGIIGGVLAIIAAIRMR